MSDRRPCPCGSGERSYWVNDARGIPLFRGCRVCESGKKQGYRRDVLTNPNYHADEPIEEE
jgi:hypothetical protein